MNFFRVVQASVRRHSELVAVEFDGDVLRYRELEVQVVRVAGALRRLEVGVGDRVLMFAPNRIESIVIYLACAYIGAIYVPVNVDFGRRELEYVLDNAEPTFAFVDASLIVRFDEVARAAGLSRRCLLGANGFDNVVASHSDSDEGVEPVEVTPDHGVLISYTSGSTARPKPVLLSHGRRNTTLRHMPMSGAFGQASVASSRCRSRGFTASARRR